MNRALDLLAFEAFAGDDEMEMDAREDLRIVGCALRVDFDRAVADRRARAAQDMDYIVSGASARSHEHGFHRTRAQVAAAAVGRAVHDEGVTAFRLGNESNAFEPFDASFHAVSRSITCSEAVPRHAPRGLLRPRL